MDDCSFIPYFTLEIQRSVNINLYCTAFLSVLFKNSDWRRLHALLLHKKLYDAPSTNLNPANNYLSTTLQAYWRNSTPKPHRKYCSGKLNVYVFQSSKIACLVVGRFHISTSSGSFSCTLLYESDQAIGSANEKGFLTDLSRRVGHIEPVLSV